MKNLRSFVVSRWHEASTDLVPLFDPSTEEVIAQTGSAGIEFAAVLDHARNVGGPALRQLTFSERADRLKATAKILRERRDELLELSRLANGTTLGDGSFDVDGMGATLSFYATLGRILGERRSLIDGDGVQLGKTEAFWTRHLLVPRRGAAVHINAFNFPAWGFGEKAACAWLAGMPVIVKPATATALVAHRAVELVVEAGIWPEGALQMICGSTGDLLDRLGPQDVLAFTGSADTAEHLRQKDAVLKANPRLNVEADSLNAAVLGPDALPGSPTFELFVRDVVREITQKAGQKCTAVRRILAPRQNLDAVRTALEAGLAAIVVGNPLDPAVQMGPLATAAQLADAQRGCAELGRNARLIRGGGRVDGVGSPAGKGFFFAPTLFEVEDAASSSLVHTREVFGPVSTLIPYDGSATQAAEIVALGGGTLVTSVYSDDSAWLDEHCHEVGSMTGRIYLGSSGSAGFGSGAALPQSQHGGPGRAGGGAELGGLRGLELYLQRVALQGEKAVVEGLAAP